VPLGSRTLGRGDAGQDVRTLQRLLGVRATGWFGPITARAVRRFQRGAGLQADGRVGPDTRAALARLRMRPRRATWYGPGLYGRRTACGQRLTPRLRGLAHRKLACGARVTLYYAGRFLTTGVVDRGPYAHGAVFDLTAATALALGLQQTDEVRAAY
jgi:rare lipoprotein A (peptidoglycan hydrolase)